MLQKICLNASTQAQRSRYWKGVHGILSLHKKGHKIYIYSIFICEPFINVINNTNSCYKGLLKYLDAGAKVKVMEKFMEQYPLTKYENFFYLDNKKIYINSILTSSNDQKLLIILNKRL